MFQMNHNNQYLLDLLVVDRVGHLGNLGLHTRYHAHPARCRVGNLAGVHNRHNLSSSVRGARKPDC